MNSESWIWFQDPSSPFSTLCEIIIIGTHVSSSQGIITNISSIIPQHDSRQNKWTVYPSLKQFSHGYQRLNHVIM